MSLWSNAALDDACGLHARCAREKRDFLNIGLSPLRRDQVLAIFDAALHYRTKLTISFLNPFISVAARRMPEIRQWMNCFDVVLADGIGVVFGARFLGIEVPERLGNDDIGTDIFRKCSENGYRSFLFGSAAGVAERAARNLQRSFSALAIAGTLHGYHFGDLDTGNRDESSDAVVHQINQSGADVLWVGLATPLQQKWVWQNREALEPPVIITSGGYLDHLAERIEWYPPVIRKFGLLWLYRLWREPRRLWRRYSVDMVQFLAMLSAAKLGQKGGI